MGAIAISQGDSNLMDLQGYFEKAVRDNDINCVALFAHEHADYFRYHHPLRMWFVRTNGEWVSRGRSELVCMSVCFLTLLANEAHA